MCLIKSLLSIYVIVVFARVVLSWFPLSPGGAMAGIYSFTYTVTEPVMGPLRRVLPPVGGFDLSPIVVLIGIQIIQRSIPC